MFKDFAALHGILYGLDPFQLEINHAKFQLIPLEMAEILAVESLCGVVGW